MALKVVKLDWPYVTTKLVNGHALFPSSSDILYQECFIPNSCQPQGANWNIMSGNVRGNLWARVALRCDIEGDMA